jgi:hypothetical protein
MCHRGPPAGLGVPFMPGVRGAPVQVWDQPADPGNDVDRRGRGLQLAEGVDAQEGQELIVPFEEGG